MDIRKHNIKKEMLQNQQNQQRWHSMQFSEKEEQANKIFLEMVKEIKDKIPPDFYYLNCLKYYD